MTENKLEMTEALNEENEKSEANSNALKWKRMNSTINSMEMMGILWKRAGFEKTYFLFLFLPSSMTKRCGID